MSNGSYVMPLNVVLQKTCVANMLELRLMNISSERCLKHAEGCAKTSELGMDMANEIKRVKEGLGDNPSAEDYKQSLYQAESIENEYTMQIEQIRNQMETAEEHLDREQEVAETKLEETNAEIETWKEDANKKAESCGYFDK